MKERTISLEDGMLFVRNDDARTVMREEHLVIVGVIALAAMAVQSAHGAKDLELSIYPDGLTHVASEYVVDSARPDFEVQLLGEQVDNFVAADDEGFLLESMVEGKMVTVETLGASSVSLSYDVHDLVSKEGRTWSFEVLSPAGYTLLMPEGAVIIGMSSLPVTTEREARTVLELGAGSVRIDYIFAAPIQVSPNTDVIEYDYTPVLAVLLATVAGAAGLIYVKKFRGVKPEGIEDSQDMPEINADLREGDQQIISFIRENGGVAKESELRKKLLQPRTSMWRAIRRLERQGIVKVEKVDMQNVIRLEGGSK